MNNLDEGLQEHFDFVLGGHTYHFRHLNTEEIEQMSRLNKRMDEEKDVDSSEMKNFLFQFVTKDKEDAPDFQEAAKKMIAPQWMKFNAMLKKEMGGK
jgi:hypothetical protein